MRQKFGKLSFVHVCKDMPEWMSHFDSDFDAIVDGTYAQKFGASEIEDTQEYSVYKIEDGKIVNSIAWYHEGQLSLLPNQDRDRAEKMIEEYQLRHCTP